jgi:hypothetical protein
MKKEQNLTGKSVSSPAKKVVKKKTKMMIVLALVVLCTLIYLLVQSGNPNSNNPNENLNYDNPNLMYLFSSWAGFCPREDLCPAQKWVYVFNNGKAFIVEEKGKNSNRHTTKNYLSGKMMDEIRREIRDSGIMNKSCNGSKWMDASVSYYINLDGEKRKYSNPYEYECNKILILLLKLII